MNNRLPISLLVAGALAFACGPRTHSQEAAATPRHPRTSQSSPLASSLDVTVGDGVTFTLHVTNGSAKRVEVDFPSGQTHDFAVLDSAGTPLWRWSDGRMFTQALQNKPLDANETATYEEHWDAAGHHGRFTVVATLASSNFPLEKRVDFTLP